MPAPNVHANVAPSWNRVARRSPLLGSCRRRTPASSTDGAIAAVAIAETLPGGVSQERQENNSGTACIGSYGHPVNHPIHSRAPVRVRAPLCRPVIAYRVLPGGGGGES